MHILSRLFVNTTKTVMSVLDACLSQPIAFTNVGFHGKIRLDF